MIDLLDSLSLAGNRAKPNDDAFGQAGNRVWVIDGATGLGSRLTPATSDAAWLAQTANRLFHTHADMRDTEQLVRVVIEGIVSAFESACIRRPEERWEMPVASLLIMTIDGGVAETVWLGDCRGLLRIGDRVETFGETPEGEAEERSFAAKIARGATANTMLNSPTIVEELRLARATCNSGAKGRWLLGLEPKAAAFLERRQARIDGPVTGLAMTDGFSALELKYGRHSAVGLVKMAETSGLAPLARELRQIEEVEDPDGKVFPRFKRSDDATAVLFRVG